MHKLNIDFYSEITCPWCLIGHHRLDKVLAERFAELSVDIIHHPVFLIPDCPPEGMLIADLMKSRHGVSDPAELWARPEAEARASGLDLVLRRQPYAYPTQGAHTLIRLARAKGTQHRLAGALYASYFRDVKNIADPRVLGEIASRHGFDSAEARRLSQDAGEREQTAREAAQATAQGITSVPHFVFGGRLVLKGGRSEDELAHVIKKAIQNIGLN